MRIPLAAAGLREMALMTAVLGGPATAAYLAAAAGRAWCWPVALLLTLAWGAGMLFFRDPERTTPTDPGILVAPADGTVVETASLDHDADIDGPATRIGIFLSLFDVHVNRSPCAGVVRSMHYHPGRWLDARDPSASRLNESNTIVIEPDDPAVGPVVVVRQIAGLIARRIACSVKVGEHLRAGQRIGLLKFGSRTELIILAQGGCAPVVRTGDRTRGAVTVLARRTATAPGGSPAGATIGN